MGSGGAHLVARGGRTRGATPFKMDLSAALLVACMACLVLAAACVIASMLVLERPSAAPAATPRQGQPQKARQKAHGTRGRPLPRGNRRKSPDGPRRAAGRDRRRTANA